MSSTIEAGEKNHEQEMAELELIRTRLCAAASQMASAQCWWLDLVAECDERGAWFGYGVRDCAHWIAYSCSMSPGTAREHVRVARALRRMPLFHAEFAAGRISYSKVREATRLVDKVDEHTMLSLAQTCTAAQFERSVRGYRRTDTDRIEQEKRRKARWFTDDDGMLVLTARLPAEEGAVLIAALQQATAQLTTELAATPPPSAPPAPAVSCADALLHLAEGFLAAGQPDLSGEDRHLVVVHVDARHLAGATAPTDPPEPLEPTEPDGQDLTAVPAAGACQVSGVGGISPRTAARLACDALVTAMIRGSAGAVLAHGRTRRLVSPRQRRALMTRDGCCQFPGCPRTHHLQADHVQSWANGGTTDLNNLILLCRLHHMAVHEAGFTLHATGVATDDATHSTSRWAFHDPAGQPLQHEPGMDGSEYPAACPVDRDLDQVTRWTDAAAEQIRPRWTGERADISNIVAVLQDNPIAA